MVETSHSFIGIFLFEWEEDIGLWHGLDGLGEGGLSLLLQSVERVLRLGIVDVDIVGVDGLLVNGPLHLY